MPRQIAPAIRWVIVGLICAIAGYVPFLTSLAHVLITQRTYVFASIGGAIAFAAAIWLSSQGSRMVAGAFALLLLSSGIGSQWEQLRHYTDTSLRQREILANVLTAVPSLPADQPMLIIDNGGVLDNTWMVKGELMRDALTYLYGHHVDVRICVNPGMLLASFEIDAKGSSGRCVHQGSTWTLGATGRPEYVYSDNNLLIVSLSETGQATIAQGVAPAGAGQPERWTSILNCWPAENCVYEEPAGTERFAYDFGKYWSLEEAPWGAGWGDAFWNPPGLQPQSAAWTKADESQLWFNLAPSEGTYRIRVELTLQALNASDGSFVSINGYDAPLIWWPDLNSGFADVPSAWLNDGTNSITLHTKTYAEWGLGVAVNRISVDPVVPQIGPLENQLPRCTAEQISACSPAKAQLSSCDETILSSCRAAAIVQISQCKMALNCQ